MCYETASDKARQLFGKDGKPKFNTLVGTLAIVWRVFANRRVLALLVALVALGQARR
jgi:hypothetical protein